MTEFKGRHLGVLVILCGTWTAARIITHLPGSDTPVAVAARGVERRGAEPSIKPFSNMMWERGDGQSVCCRRAEPKSPMMPVTDKVTGNSSALISTPHALALAQISLPLTTQTIPETPAPNPAIEATGNTKPLLRRAVSVNVYGYSFWRTSASEPGLTAAGQYGGGQSGLITTIGVSGSDTPQRLALLIRAAVAHDDGGDRELALGLRWLPKTEWPISVTAERRLRPAGRDSVALYVAGGRDGIPLPAGFKLESFGQVGVVSGARNSHFFGAHARADRQIIAASPVPIHIGAGVWTGGQRGTARLDIGPSVRTELPLGPTRIRVTADWRFRIAGNATPGNGPAVTLSTGF